MSDPNLLVGASAGDDAGVYRLDARRALVQTVDFFTPIVDDPRHYGQIAAANSLSDVYAMGGRPLTALNIMGVPDGAIPPAVIAAILKGGAAKLIEAGCLLVGGHTIINPEPMYGLAVTGLVSPRRIITNANARPGDLLVLTKPLGTGIVTTGIKRNLASPRVSRLAVRLMCRLNDIGAPLGEKGLVRAGVDVTGFGLLGHLGMICRGSGVGAEILLAQVPVISPEVRALIRQGCVPGGTRKNLEFASEFTTFEGVAEDDKLLLADAQTSGGLLLCVAPPRLAAVLALLRRARTASAAVIGQITRAPKPVVRVRP